MCILYKTVKFIYYCHMHTKTRKRIYPVIYNILFFTEEVLKYDLHFIRNANGYRIIVPDTLYM